MKTAAMLAKMMVYNNKVSKCLPSRFASEDKPMSCVFSFMNSKTYDDWTVSPHLQSLLSYTRLHLTRSPTIAIFYSSSDACSREGPALSVVGDPWVQEMLQAGLIIAGWDEVKGGSVWGVPLGGTLVEQPFTIGSAFNHSCTIAANVTFECQA